jgi:transcriptional regulator with XRE-family HTH domain
MECQERGDELLGRLRRACGLFEGFGDDVVEVAALAGVSVSTVSRVVNGSPPVAPDLARKVAKKIVDAEYECTRTGCTEHEGGPDAG